MLGELRTAAKQRTLDLAAGDVAGVHDAPLGVRGLAPEIELADFVARKLRADVAQPLNALRRLAHADVDHHVVAQAGAGDARVFRVLFERVIRREHGGDAALRPVGGCVVAFALGDQQHLAELGRAQRERQPGDSAAENQEIGRECHRLRCLMSYKSAMTARGAPVKPPGNNAAQALTRRAQGLT